MLRAGSVAIIALTMPLQSCSSQSAPASPTALPADAVAVAFQQFEAVGSALFGGPDSSMRSVIRDQQSWRTFWDELTSSVRPAPDAPPVDFTNDMVLVAAMGRRTTGGYTISVEGVYTSGGELYVDVLERSPGVGCLTTQAITSPVTAVRVQAHPEPVHFVSREESAPCG